VRGGRRRQGEGKARSCCYHRITPAQPTTKKTPIFPLNPSTKHRKITASLRTHRESDRPDHGKARIQTDARRDDNLNLGAHHAGVRCPWRRGRGGQPLGSAVSRRSTAGARGRRGGRLTAEQSPVPHSICASLPRSPDLSLYCNSAPAARRIPLGFGWFSISSSEETPKQIFL
jgi:hypothetical protein